MKRILLSTLSVVALSSIVTPAFADEVASLGKTESANLNQITPFSLVTSGFQGRLKAHGIPSGSIFLSRIRSNRIEAKDLVQSAIASGRLSEDTLNDTEYLAMVDSLITGLDRI